jgi:hypothetical protein
VFSLEANVLMILLPPGRWITDFSTNIPDAMPIGHSSVYVLSLSFRAGSGRPAPRPYTASGISYIRKIMLLCIGHYRN